MSDLPQYLMHEPIIIVIKVLIKGTIKIDSLRDSQNEEETLNKYNISPAFLGPFQRDCLS